MTQDRYVIGPGLRQKLRETITRVDSMHYPPSSGGELPYRLQTLSMPSRGGIKTAMFSGSWSIGATKSVTFKYQSGTAEAHNDLVNLPNNGSRNCIIGKEGTAWRLVNWQWDIAHAATQAELTTTQLKFHTLPVGALSTASTVTFNITVASCTTTN